MNKFIVLFVTALIVHCTNGQTTITELSLNKAVEIGLKNNPEIKSARDKIQVAEGRFWSGISLPQPEIGVSLEYTPLNKGANNYGEKTIEFRQTFEFPTIYFVKGDKLRAEKGVAAEQVTRTERRIINQIKTSYYKVLAKKYQVKYAQENVELSEDFMKKAIIRTAVGEGTNLEKLTANVQFTEAQNNLALAKNELRSAFLELRYSLGLRHSPPDSVLQLTDSLVFVDHEINDSQIVNSFKEKSPQIKIAEFNSTIASLERDLAWSSLLPGLNLAYFRQTRDGSNGFYGASFGISVPLWFMFEQKGKIQETDANLSASINDLVSAKNELNLVLRQSLTDHENNYKQVKFYASTLLPQSDEIFTTALKSYSAGELTYLEFLQAKQILVSTRNNYISALYNHYLSVFKIEEIIGQNFLDNNELDK